MPWARTVAFLSFVWIPPIDLFTVNAPINHRLIQASAESPTSRAGTVCLILISPILDFAVVGSNGLWIVRPL